MDWFGKWIGPVFDPRRDLGVFAFRRKLHLNDVPATMPVQVSADNRYKLLVNGVVADFGPQRGDLQHWFYDTVDLAPYLQPGENVIVALVWNFGYWAPMAQISLRTAFLLDDPEKQISTPVEWEIAELSAWDFGMMDRDGRNFYIEVGPGERVDGRILSNWCEIGSREDLGWGEPNIVRPGMFRGSTYEPFWGLVPRSIPPMRYEAMATVPTVRHGFVDDPEPEECDQPLTAGHPVRKSLLLDMGELVCGYPRFRISGEQGAVVTFTYAESMWEGTVGKFHKSHRDTVAGKTIQGIQDQLILGSVETHFEPLWWRTYRYLQVESDRPVRIESFQTIETGYPYSVESSFEADDPIVEPIWNVSLRTAKRCAGETYFDCPYYEQLQYEGDTRIQALIHYYLSSDRALARAAINSFRWSLQDSGLTQSRYPNRITQTIPPFSLWWIVMQRDALYYDRPSPLSETDKAAIQRVILAFKEMIENPVNSSWHFGDWVRAWPDGVPPGGPRSTMHRLTLFLAQCTELDLLNPDEGLVKDAEKEMLKRDFRANYRKRGNLVQHCEDDAWRPNEHSEALYRIVQGRLGLTPDPWPTDALAAAGADRCTYYFSYYKHRAMEPIDYIRELAPWKEMIEDGLTTFAENPPPTRSDCHAWSAHPVLGFFQIVAGVTSNAPEWRRCRIAPNPGSLQRFKARIAHPDGELRVEYEDGALHIDTPIEADVVWRGKSGFITPGNYTFKG
jgi:hypothetical protein